MISIKRPFNIYLGGGGGEVVEVLFCHDKFSLAPHFPPPHSPPPAHNISVIFNYTLLETTDLPTVPPENRVTSL